jgi:hypothetical protein
VFHYPPLHCEFLYDDDDDDDVDDDDDDDGDDAADDDDDPVVYLDFAVLAVSVSRRTGGLAYRVVRHYLV